MVANPADAIEQRSPPYALALAAGAVSRASSFSPSEALSGNPKESNTKEKTDFWRELVSGTSGQWSNLV